MDNIKFPRLNKSFFLREATDVAVDLLGKILVREYDGKVLAGRIVETEAYIARIDKASHAYGGRYTERVEPLYMDGGISYVYFIYGLYNCMNVITGYEGDAQGVLIRAVEPIEGFEDMSINRTQKPYDSLTKKQKINLTSGPAKLCMAMNIDRLLNKADLINGTELYLCENSDEKYDFDIVRCKRIGIDYAEEAIDFPWRYYIKGNKYISKKAPDK